MATELKPMDPKRLARLRDMATGSIEYDGLVDELLAAHDHEKTRADRIASVMLSMAENAQAVAVAAGWPDEQPVEDPGELVESVADLRRRAEQADSDLAAAAGELLVSLPEPGSDLAKVISANRLLRSRAEAAEAKARDWSRRQHDAVNRKVVEEGRRLQAERERDEARADGGQALARILALEAEVARLRALLDEACSQLNDADNHTANQAERAQQLFDDLLATKREDKRLRARVRVEAEDVERTGVTWAQFVVWANANNIPVPGKWADGADGEILAEIIRTASYLAKRTGLDILDEMTAIEVPSAD